MTQERVQEVRLVTRQLGGEDVEQVVAVEVGDQRLELRADSVVKVEHEAGPGGMGATVYVELLAGRVRYVNDETAPRESRL